MVTGDKVKSTLLHKSNAMYFNFSYLDCILLRYTYGTLLILHGEREIKIIHVSNKNYNFLRRYILSDFLSHAYSVREGLSVVPSAHR